MKRIEVYAVGILLALVPAVFGLWGNASFSKDVPVRVPDQARATTVVVTHNTRALVAADRAGRTPVERHHARHGADDPVTHDVGDDHGGATAGVQHDGADDTPVHHSGGDDGSGSGSGSGTSGGGNGSGTSGGGSDDKGSGGHGSDD